VSTIHQGRRCVANPLKEEDVGLVWEDARSIPKDA
jgi:hypothetical protein